MIPLCDPYLRSIVPLYWLRVLPYKTVNRNCLYFLDRVVLFKEELRQRNFIFVFNLIRRRRAEPN